MDNAQVVGGLTPPPLNTLSVNGFEGENQSEGKEVAHGFWFRNFNKRTMISETHNIDCKALLGLRSITEVARQKQRRQYISLFMVEIKARWERIFLMH
jgi:hypothetical protein